MEYNCQKLFLPLHSKRIKFAPKEGVYSKKKEFAPHGCILREKNLLPTGSKIFPFRIHPSLKA